MTVQTLRKLMLVLYFIIDLKASQPTASGHNVYDPAKSSTSKKIEGSSWRISYGDGSSASGVVYQDGEQFGSSSVGSMIIPHPCLLVTLQQMSR